jgi:hypothetical protein
MSDEAAYRNYWRRKQLLAGKVPHFPVQRWWESTRLCQAEHTIFDSIQASRSLLDIGAGDLRIKRRLQEAGFAGEYHTQDVGDEYQYTYRAVSEIQRTYSAILCLNVIEHLALREGLALIDTLLARLEPGGTLVIETPNARCVRSPLSSDMTHQHCYNLPDLWAYLTSAGLRVRGYRVVFAPPRMSLVASLQFTIGAFLTTRLLGCDYADDILVVATKNLVDAGQALEHNR